jgi:LysM repeat protein
VASRSAAESPAPAAAAPTAGASAADAALSVIVHVVRRGETLFKIAASYGVTVSDLLGINQITERTILRPGQRIRVPLAR